MGEHDLHECHGVDRRGVDTGIPEKRQNIHDDGVGMDLAVEGLLKEALEDSTGGGVVEQNMVEKKGLGP